jgi:hypothetical protein
MADQWYVAREKQKFGPYSTEQLKQFAAQGQVVPTDMLLKEGEGKWVAASTVDGLFAPQVVPPPLPAVSPEAEKGSTPFVVPDIRQLATSGSLPPALVGVGAVLAPPLGLYCVWKHPRWTVQQKWVWTGAAALVLLVGLFFIPRVVLALALLSGCALALGLVWTNTALTIEQKRLWMSVAGLVCIIGMMFVFSGGHEAEGGRPGDSRRSGTGDSSAAHEDDLDKKVSAQMRKVTYDNARRIHRGMSESDVEAILGRSYEKTNDLGAAGYTKTYHGFGQAQIIIVYTGGVVDRVNWIPPH